MTPSQSTEQFVCFSANTEIMDFGCVTSQGTGLKNISGSKEHDNNKV